MTQEEAILEMDNMLESWAERFFNEYMDAEEVRDEWHRQIENMILNWT